MATRDEIREARARIMGGKGTSRDYDIVQKDADIAGGISGSKSKDALRKAGKYKK